MTFAYKQERLFGTFYDVATFLPGAFPPETTFFSVPACNVKNYADTNLLVSSQLPFPHRVEPSRLRIQVLEGDTRDISAFKVNCTAGFYINHSSKWFGTVADLLLEDLLLNALRSRENGICIEAFNEALAKGSLILGGIAPEQTEIGPGELFYIKILAENPFQIDSRLRLKVSEGVWYRPFPG